MCSFIVTTKDTPNLGYINQYNKRRGPDYTNAININNINYVHNLLSITGEFRKQPFIKEDLVAIYNGEIYNYKEINPTASSDGESILSAYEKYGIKCFEKLDGEYAIVITDYKNKKLICGSDIFGIKPVFFSVGESGFCISSYSSVLKRSGFERFERAEPNTIYEWDLDNLSAPAKTYLNKKFDISNQHKDSFEDWNKAFSNSIRKRTTSLREKIFLGLSSGYDSGAIACELYKQNIPFKTYSIEAEEDSQIIKERIKFLKKNSNYESEYINLTFNDYAEAQSGLKFYAEESKYEIYRDDYLTPKEYMTDDKGSVGMYHICNKAKREKIKIYLSGQGADEIFSDYGHKGEKIYSHSTIGGYFPDQLENVWPWRNFYQSTQKSYLSKEENVSGANGIEGRYPFLDFDVVQEFLWLKAELKNKYYKSVLHNYLAENNFPFAPDKKVGFSCNKKLVED